MTYDRYFDMRDNYYQSDIEQLRGLVHEYVNNKNTNRQESITDIIRQIEYKEIEDIRIKYF